MLFATINSRIVIQLYCSKSGNKMTVKTLFLCFDVTSAFIFCNLQVFTRRFVYARRVLYSRKFRRVVQLSDAVGRAPYSSSVSHKFKSHRRLPLFH